MDTYIFKVTIRNYKIVGGPSFREDTEKIDENIIKEAFYMHMWDAGAHVNLWANNMNVKPISNRLARKVMRRHHNDWRDGIPEYDVEEIEIERCELRDHFSVESE